MTFRRILKIPDETLRVRSSPVTDFGRIFQTLVSDMHETMRAAAGIGLAAIQIGVPLRVFTLDLFECGKAAFVNPEIIDREGITSVDEGCLSLPGVFYPIPRAAWIKVRALDRHGNSFEMEASNLFAVAIQHEYDHLDGIIFTDHLKKAVDK